MKLCLSKGIKFNIVFFFFFFLTLISSPIFSEPLILDIEPLSQSKEVKNLCGPACAEMIFKAYGVNNIDQYSIGYSISLMIPEYKKNNPGAKNAKEFVWPDYLETYQPILAEYFNLHSFETWTTRAVYDKDTGIVPEERFNEFMYFVRSHVPVIVHVEGHYLLVVGYDDDTEIFYINDPSGGKRKEVSYSDFKNRYNRWYKGRLGWDGRYLAAWKK